MANEPKRTFGDVVRFLDENPGVHRFGDVAVALGYSRATGGNAVGSMMRAIHSRGMHGYCRRVVFDETDEHGCDTPVNDDDCDEDLNTNSKDREE